MSAHVDSQRFQNGAEKYAAYLETPAGRLRIDLAFASLKEFLPQAAHSLSALDVGSGTGTIAMRLARLGIHVTLLDSSLPMLDLAKRAAREGGVTDKIEVKHGDAAQLAKLFDPGSFDVILCHDVLEYVGDPVAVLRGVTRVSRNSSAIVSLLVRNQAGEVLKAAVQAGNLAAAEHYLTAEWGHESLYGGNVRLFTAESLQAILKSSSLTVIAERGVRVVSDYLPSQVSCSTEYDRIFELEHKLGRRPEFAAVARYTHWLAQPAPSVKGDGG